MKTLKHRIDALKAKVFAADAWEEGDHPRDKSGEFSSGGNGGASSSGASKYTPEYRAKQKAAGELVKALPYATLSAIAKERGIDTGAAKSQLMVEANKDPEGWAEKLEQIKASAVGKADTPQKTESAKAEPVKPKTMPVGERPDTSKINAPAGHERLHEARPVKRETDKAWGIENPQFAGRGAYNAHRWAMEGGRESAKHELLWIPKSQATAQNGHIVTMPRWLAEKNELATHEGNARAGESAKRRDAAMSAGMERYQALLDKAKSAGVPGVRARMKTDTLKEKMRAHGMQVDSADIQTRIAALKARINRQ